MKLVYVAGKYRSKWGFFGVLLNILHARRAAIRLYNMSCLVICPHMNTAFFPRTDFAGRDLDPAYLEAGLRMVRFCQAIYLLKGWEHSRGAQAEFELAVKLGKEIMYEEDNDAKLGLRVIGM